MSTVLKHVKVRDSEPKKSPGQILHHEILEGLHSLDRSNTGLFISGLSAGLDIGFSLFFMALMWTQAEGHLPPPVVHILIAIMYSLGFLFVVLGRSELFTEQTTLAVLPVLSGRASVWGVLRLWVIVYVANILGGACFAGLASYIGPAMGIIDPKAFGAIARKVTEHPGVVIFLSAILAGWMMGLLSWLVAASRETISIIVLVGLITTGIGFGNFHHVVLGTVEVLAGVFGGQGVTFAQYFHFLAWATLGNIIGGTLFVALIKFSHAKPKEKPEARES
jgi:formate-nitrite transporter family protein